MGRVPSVGVFLRVGWLVEWFLMAQGPRKDNCTKQDTKVKKDKVKIYKRNKDK